MISGYWFKKIEIDMEVLFKYLAAFSAVLFVVLSVVRTIHPDEWLIIRSGWMLANQQPSDLHFLMPLTLAVGFVAKIIDLPSIFIVILRLIVSLSVIASLWWSLAQQLKDNKSVNLALFLCLTCGAFICHGIEFRYDAVIMISYILCWGVVSKSIRSNSDGFVLGALLFFMAMHHTKGLYYAGLLGLFFIVCGKWLRIRIRDILLSAIVCGLAWFVLLSINQLAIEQFNLYYQFAKLGLGFEAAERFFSIKLRLGADALWWLVIFFFAGFSLLSKSAAMGNRINIIFLLIPASFILIHPIPWDYLAVPLTPFAAALAVKNIGVVACCIPSKYIRYIYLAAFIFILSSCFTAYRISLNETNFKDLKLLDLYKEYELQSDLVIDPLGALYYLNAYDKQWYLDTLFYKKLESEGWMEKTLNTPSQATVAVQSFRSVWLWQNALGPMTRYFEKACGWIWLRKGDERIAKLQEKCPAKAPAQLNLFWGR